MKNTKENKLNKNDTVIGNRALNNSFLQNIVIGKYSFGVGKNQQIALGISN